MATLLEQGAAGAGHTADQGAGSNGETNLEQAGGQDAGGQGAGGDGGDAASFFDALPEELRNAIPEELRASEAFKGHKDLPGFLKRFSDMEGELKNLPKPPETAEGYELPVAEGLELNPEYAGSFKAKALELQLTAEQAKGLAEWQNGILKGAQEKQAAAEQEQKAKANELGREALQKPEKDGGWGADFKERLDRAQRAFFNLAGENKEILDWARDPRIGASPAFLKLLLLASSKMSEDSLRDSGNGSGSGSKKRDAGPMLNFPSMDKKK